MKGALDFRSLREGFAAGLGVLAGVAGLAIEPAAASSYEILYSFGVHGRYGLSPFATLKAAGGKLYGSTAYGGSYVWCPGFGCGVTFELSAPATTGGAWTETVLHSFGGSSITDPTSPVSALIWDAKGNLYGTAANGGAHNYGVAYELSRPATTGGAWSLTVLHDFGASKTDGHSPVAALIMDAKGNLYGTTDLGGAHGVGTVFELSPPATTGGAWTETVLHSFDTGSSDGNAIWTLIMDAKGNLYGTTQSGGAFHSGAAYELSPPATSGGKWTETLLHSFNGADGQYPLAGLIMTEKGNLYGTTWEGGGNGYGVAFELMPPATTGGSWTENTLYSFGAGGKDGRNPESGLIVDAVGSLYGTTESGGAYGPYGTVFKLTP